MIKPDLGKQAMETMTPLGGGGGMTLVFIDDLDAVGRPAQLNCEIDEGVLTSGRLLVVENLLRAGLSHIDDRQTVQVMRLHFRRGPNARGIRCSAFSRFAG